MLMFCQIIPSIFTHILVLWFISICWILHERTRFVKRINQLNVIHIIIISAIKINIIRYNTSFMDSIIKKQQRINFWRENNECLYDFTYQNFLDWPCTSVQWGPLLHENPEFTLQRVYFSCRTDGIYSAEDKTWQNTPNYIVMATVQIPKEDHYFINDLKSLFNYDAAKKHPNLKVKQIITHPGEVTVIRSSPANRKLLASKSDTNLIYLWTSQRYKSGPSLNNSSNSPDLALMATKSQKPNYALRFAPLLPRVISASDNIIEVFDIDSGPTKRQLGSVLSSNFIKPQRTLQGHQKVQDLAFKNNQIFFSGGQDKEVGVWDIRVSQLTHKIKNIHQNDINSLSAKDNYILTGGEEGRVNLIDDRTYKILSQAQFHKPISSVQFNQITDHFAIGTDVLGIYSSSQTQKNNKFQPIFTHFGMRGHINEFDWNTECPYSIVATCQDIEHQIPSHGGLIHLFRPIDLFFVSKEDAITKIKQSYNRLSQKDKKLYDD